MPTKIELTLEQSQQGVSNDVLVSIERIEELKRNVWIKGENKAALPTLKAETGSIHMLSVFTKTKHKIYVPPSEPMILFMGGWLEASIIEWFAMSLSKWEAENGREECSIRRTSLTTILIEIFPDFRIINDKFNQQADGESCGYYVMRWMKILASGKLFWTLDPFHVRSSNRSPLTGLICAVMNERK
nr:hypothetical protein [Tanacetum cinerariifolium]